MVVVEAGGVEGGDDVAEVVGVDDGAVPGGAVVGGGAVGHGDALALCWWYGWSEGCRGGAGGDEGCGGCEEVAAVKGGAAA